ncbi:hypothetical protein [uncultured Erythrobacter sp.]|uniref:hypothetical protein n=1 Tax=uncultured Erythrobacter sp. TaxID=263913 RepID=UPI00262A9369|nr:hypothetical protein [uncultured Erythrobacter sp.]
MKLIIHPGLHKTGSTYLQHVLNTNHAQLTARGVWYQPQQGYPAHHSAAWQILCGDPEPLVTMIEEARAANCHTLILSSEDLEGALYDDRPLHAIDDATNQTEVRDIEWHVVLRDPGEAFASLFAQLQHHVYADAFQLFFDVLRRGFVHMAAPMPDTGTPYWYYSFDHLNDLGRLEKRAGAPVIAHDFAAKAAFPGAAILEQLGVLDAISALPGPEARNARPSRDDIIKGYVMRVAEAIPDETEQQRVVDGFLGCLENGLDNIGTYAAMVGERFGESQRAALAGFAPASVTRQPDPVR